MARTLGVTVYATASTEEKCSVARRLGAASALLYDNGGFADRIRTLTDGQGVDVVFDSLGKATLRDSLRAARTRGLIVNYGNVSGSVKDLDPYELGEAGSLFLTRPRLADHMADAATVQRRADEVSAVPRLCRPRLARTRPRPGRNNPVAPPAPKTGHRPAWRRPAA
ncbi:quinone oxidoreductase [Bordetella ansorpii]|uniref:Quinone oxidoreductase n=1 Tax=Bordetella ansorpii TaxID=288768 RepID=A0A157S778_9BORD|nr:quinone oxidoreductase [Bordetella ansorpii]